MLFGSPHPGDGHCSGGRRACRGRVVGTNRLAIQLDRAGQTEMPCMATIASRSQNVAGTGRASRHMNCHIDRRDRPLQRVLGKRWPSRATATTCRLLGRSKLTGRRLTTTRLEWCRDLWVVMRRLASRSPIGSMVGSKPMNRWTACWTPDQRGAGDSLARLVQRLVGPLVGERRAGDGDDD
jgi:hypothetical protein